MMLLIALTQAPQNLDRVVDGGFTNIDRLKTTLECRITLDVFSVLIKGGGTDALQLASS